MQDFPEIRSGRVLLQAFKQLKSLVHLGHLPKHDDRSSRAWLHGKLLVALLTQKLIRIGRDISPWRMHFFGLDNP